MNIIIVFYALFLIVFLVFSIAGIYHLWRFGYSGDMSKFIIVIYSLVSIALIVGTLMMVLFQLS